MAKRITKPDVNPIAMLVMTLLTLGGGGYFLIGQTKKAMLAWAIVGIGGLLTCGLGFAFAGVAAYDVYKLCLRLEDGEAIGVEENSLEFLNEMYRW
ncbi:MAG: hypothetical protein ACI9VR_003881 [Cognaticolwellia sp.]